MIERIYKWRTRTLVFLAATLSCTVLLKVAGIQYLEWIFAVDLIFLLVLFVRGGMQWRVFRPFLQLGTSYLLFLAAAFVLSLFALQQDFTNFHDSALKAPVIVTLARMVELFLDAFYMLYLATLFREDEPLCIFGARTYFWTGVAGCLYSFVTWPLNVFFDAQLGTYADLHRFRGFNNEGGGFGVYLVSVGILAMYMHRRRWLSPREFFWGMAALGVGLAGSQSKSAIFAMALLGVIILLWFVSGWKRWAMIFGLGVALFVTGKAINIQDQLNQYIIGSQQYQGISNLHWGDPSFVMGRVSGAVLAPRMIAARPLLGIGWGNYPLVRDNPEYRQGTAFSLGSTDSPSLGVVDYIVELGFPLWLYLTWVELKAVVMLRRIRADVWLIALALVQPVSNWAGAHLNLTHPWIVVAFALGIGFRPRAPETRPPDNPGPILIPSPTQ